MAAAKRGLKTGLRARAKTVLLMLDETVVTETPPLYACYGRVGQQVTVPITGNRAKRIVHGALNVGTGDLQLLITREWVQETHQLFLRQVRSHWRGWNVVLFEDRGSPHTAGDSRALAAARLGIQVRLLPTATPKLNAMDHLFRHVKGRAEASRATRSIDASADNACRYLLDMTPPERPRKAGVLSGNFWLTTWPD